MKPTQADNAAIGSEWEARYRVKGQSAVWPDLMVCELLTGPDKGDYVLLSKKALAGEKASEGEYRNGLTEVVS